MTIRVGRVPYLCFEPFYEDMERRGLQLIETQFGNLTSALERGELDAGPLSLVDSFRLEEGFQPVAGFCLAVSSKAGSAFLYSKVPVQELAGASIGIDHEDSTSVGLLKVLLSEKYRLQPEAYVTPKDPCDAFVITGDPALRRRRGVRGYPYKYDLGEEWHDWTELPFVFARWVFRKDMNLKDAALLEDTLYVGLEEGVDSLYHLAEPRDNLLMQARDIVEYIIGFRYFIGLSEQKAIDKFRHYLGKLEQESRPARTP